MSLLNIKILQWFSFLQTVGTECQLQTDQGPCKDKITSFYYDVKFGDCKEFIYGGCFGNPNNFVTYEECYTYCVR